MASPNPKPTDGARERQALIDAGLLRPNAGVAVTRRTSVFPLSEPSPEHDRDTPTLKLDHLGQREAARVLAAGGKWIELPPSRSAP